MMVDCLAPEVQESQRMTEVRLQLSEALCLEELRYLVRVFETRLTAYGAWRLWSRVWISTPANRVQFPTCPPLGFDCEI